MSPTLVRSSWRYPLRHPWQFGLSLLGIALGVAVYVSVELAGANAERAFELSTEAVLGRTTHQILGGPRGVPETAYAELRKTGVLRNAAPVVEGYVRAAGPDLATLTLLGLDPFAEAGFRGYSRSQPEETTGVGTSLFTAPGAVLVSRQTAKDHGWNKGETVEILVAGQARKVTIIDWLDTPDDLTAQQLRGLLVADIATAQDLLSSWGFLTRIDLILGDEAAVKRLSARLPETLELVSAAARARDVQEMTRSFEINLLMLSLLALVVGTYLIYNTMTFSVIQRRAIIGVLRAVGVTRRQIFSLVLSEAAILGLVGTVLGLLLGVLLAEVLVKLVARTINDLYFAVSVREVVLDPLVLFKGGVLGLAAALLASSVPAFEATRVAPRVALTRSAAESRMRRYAPHLAMLGFALLVLSALTLYVPGGGLGAGFVCLFGLVAGFSLVAPLMTMFTARAMAPLMRPWGAFAPMAMRSVVANLSRTAVAVAALTIALSATLGVGVMVDSFRHTVAGWLETRLRADIYVSVPSAAAGAFLKPETIERIREVEGIEDISMGRSVTVRSELGTVTVLALRMGKESYAGFPLLEGSPETTWPAFRNTEGVLVSEPFAYRNKVTLGNDILLDTDKGEQAFELVGVYRDYGSERGTLVMSRTTFDRYWDDRSYSALGVYLSAGIDDAAVIATLNSAVKSVQQVMIRSNQDLREASLEIFDRTFTITLVLRWLTTGVAVVGMLGALMALQLERAREIAILRALGMTQGQVWGVVGVQTSVMGLTAGLFSLPAGVLMALVLIFVINRRSFGWTMDLTVDPALLLQSVAWAMLAALVAAVYPAYKLTRTPPAPALREE
jgi:putative ABC transport system permease protein